MLRLPEVEYVRPGTVSEAIQILQEHGREAVPVAGGTDVIPALKRRQSHPRVLVGLHGLRELRGIRGDPQAGMVIGALTTLAEVAAHPGIREGYAALAEAAALVAMPEIRNVATLGGNVLLDTRCAYYNQSELWRTAIGQCMKYDPAAPCRVAPKSPRCLAVCSSDTAPVLVALGARFRLVGPDGPRVVPAKDFYQDDGIRHHRRLPNELLTEILLPPATGWRSTYLKLRRRGAFDFPILGVAAAVEVGADGRIRTASMVLGGVASAPVVVEAVERLRELPADAEALGDALDRVAAEARAAARPVENTDLDVLYRKRMTGVLAQRALKRILSSP